MRTVAESVRWSLSSILIISRDSGHCSEDCPLSSEQWPLHCQSGRPATANHWLAINSSISAIDLWTLSICFAFALKEIFVVFRFICDQNRLFKCEFFVKGLKIVYKSGFAPCNYVYQSTVATDVRWRLSGPKRGRRQWRGATIRANAHNASQ